MKFPFLLAGIDVGEREQLREDSETVFDESFRSSSDLTLGLFGYFVEVVQLISDHSDQIPYGLKIVLPISINLMSLNGEISTNKV